MGRDIGQGGVRPASAIDDHVVLMLQMPVGSDAHGDRPIGGALEYGGVAVVAHLIAVVFELLAEGTQFRPSLVAGRARHAVLARESRYRARRATVDERQDEQKKQAERDRARANASTHQVNKLDNSIRPSS